MMKLRLAQPSHLIDLAAVAELKGVGLDGGDVVIGAMTTQHDVIGSELLATHVPILRETAALIADPQVRYMGTIGGNVANGDPGNDMPALMMTLDATYVLRSASGERRVAARDFYLGIYETAAQPGEILAAIRIPAPPKGHGYAYEKLKRKVGDYATAAAAVVLTVAGGKIATCAIGLTNVSDRPLFAKDAAAAVIGTALDKASVAKAAAAAEAIASPAEDGRGSVRIPHQNGGRHDRAGARSRLRPRDRLRGKAMSKVNVGMTVNGKAVSAEVEPRTLLIHYLRENLVADRSAYRLRDLPLRRLHRRYRRQVSQVLHDLRDPGLGRRRAHDRGHGRAGRQAACASGGLPRNARPPMRLLHAGHDRPRAPPVAGEPVAHGSGNPHGHLRQSLPLHGLPEHRQGHPIRRREDQRRGIQGSRGMNAPTTPTSLERAEKLQGMGCKRKRVEDVRFTQGRGNYVDDIKLPGMLHGDFHRSSHAHARIVKIDTSKAKAVPGVLAVLTAEELKGVNLAWMPTLAGDVQMVLADGKVLFQNQEIAFIVATDRYIAADAADLVEVEYEALPVLVDPFKAMDADAPLLREDIKDKTEGAHGTRKHYNHIFNWQIGDRDLTDAAFLKAEVSTKDLLSYQRVHPCPLETCQAVCSFSKITGDLTIYGTFQAPHVIRTVVALISNLPEQKIHVISPDIGGGFGNKVGAYPGYICAAVASIVTGLPVKWVEDRIENLSTTSFARDYHMTTEIAATKDGRVTGLRVHILADHGAFDACADPSKWPAGLLQHRDGLL